VQAAPRARFGEEDAGMSDDPVPTFEDLLSTHYLALELVATFASVISDPILSGQQRADALMQGIYAQVEDLSPAALQRLATALAGTAGAALVRLAAAEGVPLAAFLERERQKLTLSQLDLGLDPS
jgi:hypothetical protein